MPSKYLAFGFFYDPFGQGEYLILPPSLTSIHSLHLSSFRTGYIKASFAIFEMSEPEYLKYQNIYPSVIYAK